MMQFPEEKSEYISTNHTTLHYITYETNNQPLLMLHGLTANAHAFDGLVANGLADSFTIISPDLRGRGLSGYPAFAYTVEDHAEDIINLLNHLKLDKVVLAGHSFGGLLSFYLAANYPDRIEKIVALDAAAQMNARAGEMLQSSLSRLDKKYPSWEAYLEEIKNAPFNNFWEDVMERYYRADVKDTEDGGVTPRSVLMNILEVAFNVGKTDWACHVKNINQPVLLINAMDEYTLGEPLLPEEKAKETVEMLKNASYIPVDGNHHTMLYGKGAKQIVKAINAFVA